ncbi:MAG: peptidoglycan bridge formation glycyltransferase FemA/FemB family protein [Coprobacillus cateniformis]
MCEFERFDLFRTDISKYYGNIKFVSHNIVKYVALDDDEIFNNMERRARKNIRKAIKNELSIEIDENFENLDEFKKIYYMTMDRNNATENYYFSNSFFDTITVENSKLFHVKYNGQIISTELVLYDNLCSYSF